MHDLYHALVLANGFLPLETTEGWARKRIADTVRDLRKSDAFGDDEDCLDESARLLDHADQLGVPRS